MVRQARSEATRRKIIDSAVDLINEIGYPAAGLGDIIERAELTKGALYYHFDSKEALATAIIEEGSETVLSSFRGAGRSGSPAMENVIHGSFVVTDVLTVDRVSRAGARLLRTFGSFNPAAKSTLQILVDELTEHIAKAIAEGDLRASLDPGPRPPESSPGWPVPSCCRARSRTEPTCASGSPRTGNCCCRRS